MPKINCAIYTRKSTEHGLDMEFNSLQNQEEACKAYILSQAFNQWEYYKTYSDGGISGGTMERPGLLQMLADIRARKIQMVIVYKVDRLSRSIIDFHKMMQEFDKYGCNFVSITQSFDTSNSMGKLTLNMLLSFAQFEREVSAERVRDKIAASKAKGLWMGGVPPLGYVLKDKQLIPEPQESQLVNLIFHKYLELGGIQDTADWLNQQGYHSKCWQTVAGNKMGGRPFKYGSIQRILGNPVYIGQIAHLARKKVYPGKHPAIITKELFEAVQTKMGADRAGLKERRRYIRQDSLLGDVLVDEQGRAYKLSTGKKGVRRFKYYVIRNGAHLAAEQLDRLVLQSIQNGDYSDILPRVTAQSLPGNEVKRYLERVVCQKEGKACHVTIYLKKQPFETFLEGKYTEDALKEGSRAQIKGESIVLQDTFYIDNVSSTRLQNGRCNNILTVRRLNESLVRGLARAWQLKKLIASGQTTREWEKKSGLNKRTFARYLNLCYLSPKIVTDILEYRNSCNMSLKELMNLAEGETEFERQERAWCC